MVMAYRKVCDAQAGPLVAEALHCSTGLDLDWDLDKEEPQEAAAGMEHDQMQRVVECQRSGKDFLLTLKERSVPRIQLSVTLSSQGSICSSQDKVQWVYFALISDIYTGTCKAVQIISF